MCSAEGSFDYDNISGNGDIEELSAEEGWLLRLLLLLLFLLLLLLLTPQIGDGL